jgi:hypothetical protein
MDVSRFDNFYIQMFLFEKTEIKLIQKVKGH